MTHFVFPDNTVLCNFAAVRRLDLLRDILRDRGRWTEAVAHEASMSSTVHPDLKKLPADGWLKDPIEIDDEHEVQQVERVRRAVFGGTDVKPLQHLGEAQTCHLIQARDEFAGAWWVSDDAEAVRYAKRQEITTRETIDLIGEAVAMGDITAQGGYSMMFAMASAGRHLRLPSSPADLQL